MRKNTASQVVSAQLVSKLDGSNVTSGTTTVYVTVDGGTQASSGTATHEGQGQWSYLPTQAETNGNQVAFTFVNSSAVSATVNVWPVSYDPTDSVRMGLTALPNAAPNANGGLPVLSVSGTTLAYTISTLTTYTGNTPQTGDCYARLGAPAGASVSADVAAVKVDTAAILDDTGTSGVVVASGSKSGYALSTSGLDAVVIEGSTTIVQSARGWNSVLLAKASGLATTTAVYRDLADSKARVTATVDADGNRTAITRDLT